MLDDFFAGEAWDELEVKQLDLRGIDPWQPTEAAPGSDQKVLTLAARYAAGVPLWHNDDSYDHEASGAVNSEYQSSYEYEDAEEIDDLELAEV
jgi:hypothetical protein